MANYLNEHRTRQRSKVPIGKSSLQKGMIISFYYTDKDGNSSQEMAVVLNPSYHGKLHAVSLKWFSRGDLNDLAESTGIVIIPMYKVRGLNIPKLEMKASSNRFYNSKLKGARNVYRTYFLNKVSGTLLIDYTFNKKLEEDI